MLCELQKRGFILDFQTSIAVSLSLPDTPINACLCRKSGRVTLWLAKRGNGISEHECQGMAFSGPEVDAIVSAALRSM